MIFAGELMPSASSFFCSGLRSRAVFCRSCTAQCNALTHGRTIKEHFEHETLVLLGPDISSPKTLISGAVCFCQQRYGNHIAPHTGRRCFQASLSTSSSRNRLGGILA